MKRIIHITPTLPPAVNGLGDFCEILVNNLQEKGFLDHVFLVRNYGFKTDGRDIVEFGAMDFYRKLSDYKADVLILHYVGYAYHKMGIPFYLVSGLSRYRKETGCNILVFFHELYATSRNPSKLTFYTGFLQKLIVKRLCDLADQSFTNCSFYHDLLQKLVTGDKSNIICTGIYSNIPDSLFDASIGKEEYSLVVFGSYKRRKAVYENTDFADMINQKQIRLIYDIGPGEINFNHPKIEFNSMGSLLPQEVAYYLNRAKFGALSYKPHLLGKSGIYSAYSAFGVIPLNLVRTNLPLHDNLIEGKNYHDWKSLYSNSASDDNTIKMEVLKWYLPRSQRAVSNIIFRFI